MRKVRIIPARAGFTPWALTTEIGGEDHPRSRGVYLFQQRPSAGWGGSSPLARGLLSEASNRYSKERIIPARAGFTAQPIKGDVPTKDHPRSRGVYPTLRGSPYGSRGSSPLARGLRSGCVTGTP